MHITNNSGGMMTDKNEAILKLEAFAKEDVYLDYPYEDVMFRHEKDTGRVFRQFYNETEKEIDPTSSFFHEAIRAGHLIDKARYFKSDDSNQ